MRSPVSEAAFVEMDFCSTWRERLVLHFGYSVNILNFQSSDCRCQRHGISMISPRRQIDDEYLLELCKS